MRRASSIGSREHIGNSIYSEEHVVLADWLGTSPRTSQNSMPSVDEALKRLGFKEECTFGRPSAAVAAIALNSIEASLPQWGACFGTGEKADVILSRTVKARRKEKLQLLPQHLLTIIWADTAPGFSWPCSYHVTYVPLYDVHVVTGSDDCADVTGYTDFAIGWFGSTENLAEDAFRIVWHDWSRLHKEIGQHHWAYVWTPGLISREEAEAAAAKIWLDGGPGAAELVAPMCGSAPLVVEFL